MLKKVGLVILNRNLLVDYTACYGTPSNSSAVTFTRIYIFNHISNGEPGTFYIDDVQLTTGSAKTSIPSTSSTILTTTQNTIVSTIITESTPSQSHTERETIEIWTVVSILITVGSVTVIIVLGVLIIRNKP